MASATKTEIDVAGKHLTLSNLDKVLYPDSGFTKRTDLLLPPAIAAERKAKREAERGGPS